MGLTYTHQSIEAAGYSTLLWDQGVLVDVVTGMSLSLNGSVAPKVCESVYPFDRSVGIRQGEAFWSVAYENRGTKGLLLKNGHIQRELNRSYYLAKAYDYPVTLAVAPDQRVVVIHCPHAYDVLEVECAETGAQLASRKCDLMEFHSRLSASKSGRWLLDAGWLWHPLCGAYLCDLEALLNGATRSASDLEFSFGAEIDAAAFLGADHLVLTSTQEVCNESPPPSGIGPLRVGVWSLEQRKWVSQAKLCEPTGTIMPWRDWIISFNGHPKVIEIGTGRVVQRWEGIFSGTQVGCVELGDPPPPQLALDECNGRFAVAGPDSVSIITLVSIPS